MSFNEEMYYKYLDNYYIDEFEKGDISSKEYIYEMTGHSDYVRKWFIVNGYGDIEED